MNDWKLPLRAAPNANFPFSYFLFSFRGGTGSYPCVPQGWHLAIRLVPNQNPLNGP